MTIDGSRWSGTLATIGPEPQLDLDDCIGQVAAGYRFDLVDAVTGYRRQLHPDLSKVPTLSHDTSRTIKRTITGLWFDRGDTAELNTISARIEPIMLIAGQQFPLGQYLFNDQTRLRYTSGIISTSTAYDNGFIVDQELEQGFPIFAISGGAQSVQVLIGQILAGVPITYTIDSSPFTSAGSWTAGTHRGYALEQLAVDGDYLSPWFDNTNVMRFIRSFDPADAVVTFDFDTGHKVLLDPPPVENDDVLAAANRFIVVSNGSTNMSVPIRGIYDIPSTAPHSIANRGFVIPRTVSRQVETSTQAQAIAVNLGQRRNIFERLQIATAPDPRHDSYQVIRWQGENWLETAWSLPMVAGGVMTHTARKVYSP